MSDILEKYSGPLTPKDIENWKSLKQQWEDQFKDRPEQKYKDFLKNVNTLDEFAVEALRADWV